MKVYPIYEESGRYRIEGNGFALLGSEYETWRDENEMEELADDRDEVKAIHRLFHHVAGGMVEHVLSAPIGGGWALYAVVR